MLGICRSSSLRCYSVGAVARNVTLLLALVAGASSGAGLRRAVTAQVADFATYGMR